MTKSQADHFELHPHFKAAILLRRFDDQANGSMDPITCLIGFYVYRLRGWRLVGS